MSEARINSLSNESNTGGPTLSGITTFSGTNYFVPPVGSTEQRPENPQPGALRFNTDRGGLEYFRGNTLGWVEVEARSHELGGLTNSAEGRGTRGLFSGGHIAGSPQNPAFNNVDAITIETLGNTMDFNNLTGSFTGQMTLGNSTRSVVAGGRSGHDSGSATNQIQYCNFASTGDYVDSGGDLTANKAYGAGLATETRGIFACNSLPYNKQIDYITISSIGNAIDFGDVHTNKGYVYGLSSSTRGIIAGGIYCCPGISYSEIEYVTISSTGDALDFGDILTQRYEGGVATSATRGVIMAGYGPNYTSTIEYLTMATKGNTVDFGDLTNLNGTSKYSACSRTRGVVGGGYVAPATPYSNVLEYIQIATTGNSTDFGDFINFGRRSGCNIGASNGHGGL